MSEGPTGTGVPPPAPPHRGQAGEGVGEGCTPGPGTRGWRGHSVPAWFQEGRAGPVGVSTLVMDHVNRDTVEHSYTATGCPRAHVQKNLGTNHLSKGHAASGHRLFPEPELFWNLQLLLQLELSAEPMAAGSWL